MQKLVIASNNPGKLREISAILSPLDFEAFPQSAFNIPEAEEPYCTFIENCLTKARHASAHSGLPALADDSGICVNALNGAPGVYSARFAGEPKSDERNNQKLIESLQGQANRKAHYYCIMVYVRFADDPQPIIAEGEWHGEIAHEERGEGGFGYDPMFWLPELGRMSAELSPDEKAQISHRAKALRILLQRLRPA